MASKIENILTESNREVPGENVLSELALAKEALDEALQAGDTRQINSAQAKYARLLARIGHYGEARELSEEILQRDSSNTAAIQACLNLGNCAAETDDLPAAEKFFNQAADLSRLLNERGYLIQALHSLASSIYLTRGQFELALAYTENVRMLIEDADVPDWRTPFLSALIYEIVGNRKKVRQFLDELLPMVKPATYVAGGYYFLWARLVLDEEELDKAEEYLTLALRIANQTGAPDLNIWVRMEQSRYHRMKSELPVACSWAEDGLNYAQRVGSDLLAGQAHTELAKALSMVEDYGNAESHLLHAIKLFEKLGAAFDLAHATFILSNLYKQIDHEQADQLWIKSAELIFKGGFEFILERERNLAFPLIAVQLRSRDQKARQAAETMMQHLAKVPPPPLRIYGLGQFTVFQSQRRIQDQAWQRRKSGELFRYLLLKPNHSAGRDEILEDLWGEHSPDNAQDLFHQATSTLRHILEPDLPEKFPSRYLSVEGERVYLNLPAGTLVDFEQFETFIQRAIQTRSIENLERALSQYLDDLFPMDRYKDWSASRRESLSELRQRGILALGQAYLKYERILAALDCARRVLVLDSWNEDAALLGMNACIALGDNPRALRIYLEIESILKKELAITPRSDLQAIANKIRLH
jgi:DNA-binding SARP family transcriptional activator